MYFGPVGLILSLTTISQGFVICPYCDPNHVAYPNLEEAMRGYDVPMGNPNPPSGSSDPGIRSQIFSPMFRNKDGYYRLNTKFVTANTQIKVSAWIPSFQRALNWRICSSVMQPGLQTFMINSTITSMARREL